MQTPWGKADNVIAIAPGIKWVSTPSHGGYRLSPARNRAVPEAWRNATFSGNAKIIGTDAVGWYEEDCDWCLVWLAFPDVMNEAAGRAPGSIDQARRTFKRWFIDTGKIPASDLDA